MDETEIGIAVANPNDRLSSSNLELNRLNSVQLLDSQNVKKDCSREINCITNTSTSRTDINDVRNQFKEKLHLSNTNIGLLNGYNCHNLNGIEEEKGVTDNVKKCLSDCEIIRPDCTSEKIVQNSDDLCKNSNGKSLYETCHTVCIHKSQLDENWSDTDSKLYHCAALNKDAAKNKVGEMLQHSVTFSENEKAKVEDSVIAREVTNRCKSVKSSICNCKTNTDKKCSYLENGPSSVCRCCDQTEKRLCDNSDTATNEELIKYVGYESENQMPDIMRLIQKDLSEPYSIYTYRYFIHNWPKLCFLAMDNDKCVGAIVCKLDMHKKHSKRGYIAMLAVDENYRKRKIGSNLVLKAIQAMIRDEADEVVLETEITNKPALRLYENLGFVRDKRLFRYYLNGVDALRLKLWLR
ncbi:uncharacterized protein [Centruroides vittatus]|uniref:uncharacterized protein n=1 Tax=Centruroides vittatus TaxID=120091 RepID=UPI003510466A